MITSSAKRGTAELAILSVLERAPLHGYEIARRIEQQTQGDLHFTLASLYPLLYRMEQRGCDPRHVGTQRLWKAPPRLPPYAIGKKKGVTVAPGME